MASKGGADQQCAQRRARVQFSDRRASAMAVLALAARSRQPPHGRVQPCVFHRYTRWTAEPASMPPPIQPQNHGVPYSHRVTLTKITHLVTLNHTGCAFVENATRNSRLIVRDAILISPVFAGRLAPTLRCTCLHHCTPSATRDEHDGCTQVKRPGSPMSHPYPCCTAAFPRTTLRFLRRPVFHQGP